MWLQNNREMPDIIEQQHVADFKITSSWPFGEQNKKDVNFLWDQEGVSEIKFCKAVDVHQALQGYLIFIS